MCTALASSSWMPKANTPQPLACHSSDYQSAEARAGFLGNRSSSQGYDFKAALKSSNDSPLHIMPSTTFPFSEPKIISWSVKLSSNSNGNITHSTVNKASQLILFLQMASHLVLRNNHRRLIDSWFELWSSSIIGYASGIQNICYTGSDPFKTTSMCLYN